MFFGTHVFHENGGVYWWANVLLLLFNIRLYRISFHFILFYSISFHSRVIQKYKNYPYLYSELLKFETISGLYFSHFEISA